MFGGLKQDKGLSVPPHPNETFCNMTRMRIGRQRGATMVHVGSDSSARSRRETGEK